SIAAVDINAIRTYSYIDRQPLTEGFYRIKAFDHDHRFGYSSVVRIQRKTGTDIKAYISSPAQLVLESKVALSGGSFYLINSEGKILSVKQIAEGSYSTTIDISSIPK